MTLLDRALANRHTQSSFRNLSRHADAGHLDRDAALRLLRNNVRDVAPDATADVQQRIAIALLTHWTLQRNSATQVTQSME